VGVKSLAEAIPLADCFLLRLGFGGTSRPGHLPRKDTGFPDRRLLLSPLPIAPHLLPLVFHVSGVILNLLSLGLSLSKAQFSIIAPLWPLGIGLWAAFNILPHVFPH
jgi:hypothetical protein